MTLANLIGKLDDEPPQSVQWFNRELSASHYIPITHLSAPHRFVTRKGELGAIIQVQGTSFSVQDRQDIEYLQSQLAFSIKNLTDEFALYVTTYHHQEPVELGGEFPAGFAREFVEAYQHQFKGAELFDNDIYVVLLKRNKQLLSTGKFKWLTNLKAGDTQRITAERRRFDEILGQFISSLAPYSPRLLEEKLDEKTEQRYNEILTYLSILGNAEAREFTYPYQDIASYIPYKRIYAGFNTIHFQGNTAKDDLFGAILSIKAYQPHTLAGMLDGLLNLPFTYISTHAYLGIDKAEALTLIEKQERRLKSTQDAARSQIADLEQAKDDLMSDRINYGLYHNTVMVLTKNLEQLDDAVAKAARIYEEARLVAVRETINLENAYWAQFPGNAKHSKRSVPISNNNFACFCPLHNYYQGYFNQNHLGSALMLVETQSRTPFYFNLHERASGRKNDLSKGHTIIIGSAGSGKTVILTILDVMFRKYKARGFFFDRNQGCETYVRAMNGNYYRLTPGEPTHWNPCQLDDTPANREFLREFIKLLCGKHLTPRDINQIAEVVDRNYSLPREKRTLSNISSFFGLDFTGLTALSRWLHLPDRNGRPGEYAYLFDNATDTLDVNQNTIFGFDMTSLLGSGDEATDILAPVMRYLFYRIEQSLDGRLTNLYLDEGWQLLNHPYWMEKLDGYLVTWRKLNANIIFASQLPKKVIESPIGATLIQGSATQLFLGNQKAEEKDYREGFKLTHREFEIIKNTPIQSRYFLIKQGHEAAVARINLSGLDKYIKVLSATKETVDLCEQIRQEVGDEPSQWLPLFYQEEIGREKP